MANKLTSRAFLADIGKLAQNFRLQIEAEVDGFNSDPAALAARRAQAMGDYRFFARTYFPHYIKHAEAALHTYLYDRLPQIIGAGAPTLTQSLTPTLTPTLSQGERGHVGAGAPTLTQSLSPQPSPPKAPSSQPSGETTSQSTKHDKAVQVAGYPSGGRGEREKPFHVGAHEAIAAPRGNAKSTLVTQIFVIWCIVTGRKHYPIIVMDALDQAATMLEAIKAELAFNPRLLMDFPEATGAGRVWQVGTIITANDAKVQAFGSGKRMRGLRHGPHRPDLVIGDDLENDENVRSPEQRDKLENWLKKTVLSLGAADDSMDVIIIGTILHYDSVLSRLLKNPLWTSKKFKSIERWPDNMALWDKWEEALLNYGAEAARAFYDAQAPKNQPPQPPLSGGGTVQTAPKPLVCSPPQPPLSGGGTVQTAPKPLVCSPPQPPLSGGGTVGATSGSPLRPQPLLTGGGDFTPPLTRGGREGLGFVAQDHFADTGKIVHPMEQGAIVCWPEGQSLYTLMVKRARDGRAAFDSEQQNDPVSGDDAPFAHALDQAYWQALPPNLIYFGACDPSLGKAGASRDPSALLVGGFDRATGILYVVEALIKKRLPDKIISDVIGLQKQYRCALWSVEAVQFQEFLYTELVKRSAAAGVPVPARAVKPSADKLLRIETLQPHFVNGLIKIHPSQATLIDQLRHFPKADHDDGPDALHMLWAVALSGSQKPAYQSARRSDDDEGRRGGW